MKVLLLSLIFLASAAGVPAAHASSTMRCNSQLISLGDYSSEVQDKCGEPVSRDFLGYYQQLDDYGYPNEVAVERWRYGPRNGMNYYLRFQGDRLTDIESKRGR
jgi:hypothetical protein